MSDDKARATYHDGDYEPGSIDHYRDIQERRARRVAQVYTVPPGPHTGRGFPEPRVAGQAVEPSTANIDVRTHPRDYTYIDAMQQRFDGLKESMFAGLTAVALGTARAGMGLNVSLRRPEVDMIVLHHMAGGDEWIMERPTDA